MASWIGVVPRTEYRFGLEARFSPQWPFGLTEREKYRHPCGAPSDRPVDLDRRGIPQRLVEAILVVEVEIAIHPMVAPSRISATVSYPFR